MLPKERENLIGIRSYQIGERRAEFAGDPFFSFGHNEPYGQAVPNRTHFIPV